MINKLKNCQKTTLIGQLPDIINSNNQSVENEFNWIFDSSLNRLTKSVYAPTGSVKSHFGEFVNLACDYLTVKNVDSLQNSIQRATENIIGETLNTSSMQIVMAALTNIANSSFIDPTMYDISALCNVSTLIVNHNVLNNRYSNRGYYDDLYLKTNFTHDAQSIFYTKNGDQYISVYDILSLLDPSIENSPFEFGTGVNSAQLKGYNAQALGRGAVAEGDNTVANGDYSHAEGSHAKAINGAAHAEGFYTTAYANYSHAEGQNSSALGTASHAEGYYTIADSSYAHAEGKFNVSHTNSIHTTGIGTAGNKRQNAFEITSDGSVFVIGVGGYNGSILNNASTLQKTISNINSSIGNINSSIGNINSSISNINSSISNINSSIGNINSSIGNINSSITTLNSSKLNNISLKAGNNNVSITTPATNSTNGIIIATSTISVLGYVYDTVNKSFKTGDTNTATGQYSFATGYDTSAIGGNAHAEGSNTFAFGGESHAEGKNTRAYGDQSHTEGLGDDSNIVTNITLGNAYIHKNDNSQIAELYVNKGHGLIPGDAIKYGNDIPRGIVDIQSDPNHQDSRDLITITPYNLNENIWHTDTDLGTISVQKYPKTFGSAYGISSHTEGKSIAVGNFSHGEGYETLAIGNNSHAGGTETQAKGNNAVTFGEYTIADYHRMFVIGKYNRPSGTYNYGQDIYNTHYTYSTYPDTFNGYGQELLTVGYGLGTGDATATIFKVNGNANTDTNSTWSTVYLQDLYADSIHSKNTNIIGWDYAEYLEWKDGNINNEDRTGLFVKLNEDKIEIADAGDDVIGIISAVSGIIGNAAEEEWHDKYMKDQFGRPIIDNSSTDSVVVGKNRYVVNPEYDSSLNYIPRSKRKEWGIVGFMGQFIVIDDGTCIPGKRCVVADGGIATLSNSNIKGYRVMKRIDENHIKIIASFL